MNNDQLKLSNQFCFPIYTFSRLITKIYKPFLNELGLTYTQYLVMLVLWEKDNVPVKEISEKLLLETNTLTPLLKRMETNEILKRIRSKEDERVVILSLTKKGNDLAEKAKDIPSQLIKRLEVESINEKDVFMMKNMLCEWIDQIEKK